MVFPRSICWPEPAPMWLNTSDIWVNYTNSFVFNDDKRPICCNFIAKYSEYAHAVWWEHVSGDHIFEVWNFCLHIWPNTTHLQSGVYKCVFQDKEVFQKKFVVLSKSELFIGWLFWKTSYILCSHTLVFLKMQVYLIKGLESPHSNLALKHCTVNNVKLNSIVLK